tara:strand:- start:200 stop:946 length:747 start_codon:yes stop_codon:yes gene_type:complete
MIRNYYTEAFKGGITPVVSATQLIDGTVKIINQTTSTSVSNTVPSVTIVLNLNRLITQGMYITGGGVTINDQIIVQQVVHSANTTVTLNKSIAMNAGQVQTFFNIAQSSWKEYNLYIGSSPANYSVGVGAQVTQGIASASGAGSILTIKTANTLVAAGQLIYDDGVLIGVVASIDGTDKVITTANPIPAVADLSIIDFVNPGPASVSVLTASNQTITFTNPAEGFVLPVSVVQVTATANSLGNLIALD